MVQKCRQSTSRTIFFKERDIFAHENRHFLHVSFLRFRGLLKSPNQKPTPKTETKPNHPIARPSIKSPNALPGKVGQHDLFVCVETAHLGDHFAAGIDARREAEPRGPQNRMPLLDGPEGGHFGMDRVNTSPIGRGHGHDVGVQL